MNAPVDTLAFAQSFEEAGFGHDQARAIAAALGTTYQAGREDVVTREALKAELAELKLGIVKEIGDLEVRLTRQIGDVGKDISNRLWSTVTIIAGVSTAISATIGAAVALLLRSGGI